MQTEFLSVVARKQSSISSMMMVIMIITVTLITLSSLIDLTVLPVPTNLRSVLTASTSVTLSWDAPDSSSSTIILTSYTVMWNSEQRTLTTKQYTIRQLVPFQEYQFSVHANFAEGGRSEFVSINVTTLEAGKPHRYNS